MFEWQLLFEPGFDPQLRHREHHADGDDDEKRYDAIAVVNQEGGDLVQTCVFESFITVSLFNYFRVPVHAILTNQQEITIPERNRGSKIHTAGMV